MIFEITAQTRKLQGTGASRRLRASGRVPAIVYGGADKPAAIDLDHNEILLALRKEAFQSSIINLNLDGKKQPVLLRDVQAHAYKKLVLHVDFQRVDETHEIHIKVPLHFVNAEQSPGVKQSGGIVSHVTTEIDVKCLAKNLPEFIEVDLKDMVSGHSIHAADIKFPEGVKLAHADQNPVVATILAVRGADEAAAPAAGEAPKA
jgi:large subunit ribosomal protein L25